MYLIYLCVLLYQIHTEKLFWRRNKRKQMECPFSNLTIFHFQMWFLSWLSLLISFKSHLLVFHALQVIIYQVLIMAAPNIYWSLCSWRLLGVKDHKKVKWTLAFEGLSTHKMLFIPVRNGPTFVEYFLTSNRSKRYFDDRYAIHRNKESTTYYSLKQKLKKRR